MEIFVLWLFLSIVAGVIASNKGRSGLGFFLLSVILSPLIGIITALVAGSNTSKVEEKQIEAGGSKKCPFCAEIVKSEAKVCRFCGRDLPKQQGPEMISSSDYASAKGIEHSTVLDGLREGRIIGRQIDGEWYVSAKEL